MGKKELNKSPDPVSQKITAELPKKFVVKKWLKIIIAIFLLLVVLPAGTAFGFEKIFSDKIYPGIKINDLKLGGKTKDEAMVALREATKKFNEEGVTFVYQNKTASLAPLVTAANDPDLSRTVFSLENEQTVKEAFALGRNKNFLANLGNQVKFLLLGKSIPLKYQINEDEMIKVLKESFGYLEKEPQDAKINYVKNGNGTQVVVSDEQDGRTFNYSFAINDAFLKISKLIDSPAKLELTAEKAKIKKAETALAAGRAEKLAGLCFLALGETKKTWVINQAELRDNFEFQQTKDGLTVGLNKEKVEEYLKKLAAEIDVLPQNAKFTIENGLVEEFQLHQGGKELNIEASYDLLNNYVKNFDETKIQAACPKNPVPDKEEIIQMIVTITAPQVPIGTINNLGIQELVGTGTSDFSGSPTNRRHNIKVGATKLNGVLIAPGEEFSLVKTLGEIDASTGYLPELVIKGDKTIPEYGGGLCQIGTTAFRVALDAGLPITERRPHSYRVVYYEPAGMDATIYSPRPDLKFVNDTPAYLLLQTRIDGDELTFELWGTPDGRKVEMTTPRVFNFVSPGPTKIIETADLAPGVKKCTERAHTGADAEFDRTITYKDGEIKTETWSSHYVPWSAVCLVGKEPTPTPPETPTIPTSPDGIPDPALLPLTF